MKKIEFDKYNKTKKNHYISQAYLKNFFNNVQNSIAVYDKNTKSIFETNIMNIGMQNKLYVVENENKELKINWEEFYTKAIDNDILKIINTVIDITSKDYIEKPLLVNNVKYKIALAMIIQSFRIPQRIYSQEDTYIKTLNTIIENVRHQNIVENEHLEELKEKYSNEMHYKDIFFEVANKEERIELFANVLLGKTWLIYVNKTKIDFLISDNPILIYDFVNKKATINNGISNPETLIAYPITSKYMIVVFPNQYLFGKIKENFSDKKLDIYEENVINSYNKLQFDNANKQVYGKNKQEIIDLLNLLK